MRRLRNSIASFLLASALAAPATGRSQRALLEKVVALAGLGMLMDSGAVGMALALTEGSDELIAGLAPQ